MNILIVDDIPTNLKLLRVTLEAEEFHVLSATNGFEALAVLEHEPVDAVISDILMPRMDGYRLCYELRRSERFHLIPFIVYTSTYTSSTDEKVAFDLGADKFIRKPAPSQVMLGALREVTTEPKYKQARSFQPPPELEVMKEYSERLVAKLEEKNTKLIARNKDLQESEERFRKLSEELELHVTQRTEELTKANRELEAFSYSVSHDLRGPLRAVDGYSQIMLEDYSAQLPEDGRQKLEAIRKGARQMGRLIDDLLAFSRLGRSPLKKRDVNTGELVRDVLEELNSQREGRQVEIRIGDLPACQGDLALLTQVWINLLSNALKYTRYRQPAVIEIGSKAEQHEQVYFVRDNGAGFDMRYADKLFGVFQRLHSKEEFEGTGIGLANIQRIIHRHGGRVWAEGVLDGGATFYFSLPR